MGGLTLEFLSYKILENFMRNEFRTVFLNLCFTKFRVSRNLLLAYENQFRIFRISQIGTIKHAELNFAKLAAEKKPIVGSYSPLYPVLRNAKK